MNNNRQIVYKKIISLFTILFLVLGNISFLNYNSNNVKGETQEIILDTIIVPVEISLVDAFGVDISILINSNFVSEADLVQLDPIMSNALSAYNQIEDTLQIAIASSSALNFTGNLFFLSLKLKALPEEHDELFKITRINVNDEVKYQADNYILLSGIIDGGIYNYSVFPLFNKGVALMNGDPFVNGTKVENEGLYNLVITDNFGFERQINFEIDKTPPVINILEYETNPTLGPITVYAEAVGGTLKESSYTFYENGEYTFEARDIAGNIGYKEVVISNIFNGYTITFNTDGGSEIDSITQLEGSLVTAPSDPLKEGHTFIGWDTEIPLLMPGEDIIITAIWQINFYTVTFKDWDGSILKEQEVEYGNFATAPENPVKEGYTFVGWDAEFNNIVGDLTVTANYGIRIIGNINILGIIKYSELLTVDTSTLTPSDSTISYQWKRNGTAITGATNSSYTIIQADIGQNITVIVTGTGDYAGSITSTAVTPTKADQSTSPTKPVLSSKMSERIVITTVSGHEYRLNNGAWQTSGTFTGLNPDTSYKIYSRISENATHFASSISEALDVKTDAAQISSSKYFISRAKAFISKIKLEETIKNFIAGILNNTSIKIFSGNVEVKDTDLVATGMKLRQYSGTTVTDELTIVVTGDITGNGRVGLTDFVQMKSHLLGKTTLTGEYAAAADVNGDGRITLTDYIGIKAHLLGKENITAREHK